MPLAQDCIRLSVAPNTGTVSIDWAAVPASILVMQLTAQHQAPSDIGSLQCRALGR
jgi:hypothetical protein